MEENTLVWYVKHFPVHPERLQSAFSVGNRVLQQWVNTVAQTNCSPIIISTFCDFKGVFMSTKNEHCDPSRRPFLCGPGLTGTSGRYACSNRNVRVGMFHQQQQRGDNSMLRLHKACSCWRRRCCCVIWRFRLLIDVNVLLACSSLSFHTPRTQHGAMQRHNRTRPHHYTP